MDIVRTRRVSYSKFLLLLSEEQLKKTVKKYVFLVLYCISLWELIEILTKKYLREMYRATFIAQPVILGIMEL